MKKKVIALFLALLILVGCLPVGATEIGGSQLYYAINDIINFITANYHFGVEDEELLRAVMKDAAIHNGGQLDFERAMNAIFQELDEYSEYYTREEFNALKETAYGSFSGIGVTYLMQNGMIFITEVFENGPAAEAGILPGDSIVSVDGQAVSEIEQQEVANMIRGETGTTVQIGIKRGESVIVVPVVRAQVEIQEINSEIIPGEEVGYIRITGFNMETADKLSAILGNLKKENIKKIIIDLRDNPGGLLSTVLSCLDLLVPRGKTTLNVKYKDEEEVYKSGKKTARKEFELVVLVNENSASASEVFAGAIQDNRIGVIIGTKTYGKGTVQHLVPLNTGAGIKLTTGEFFTPNGNVIRDNGITPNIIVENKTKTVKETDLESMNLFTTFDVGMREPSILGIEERLEVLGYFTDIPDLEYTEETATAIKWFQFVNGYEVTGVADTQTLVALNDIEYEFFAYTIDNQLKAAIEELK